MLFRKARRNDRRATGRRGLAEGVSCAKQCACVRAEWLKENVSDAHVSDSERTLEVR